MIAGSLAHGFINHWKNLVPHGLPWPVYIILIPIELMGMFVKPFALTMRLAANMTGGHIAILALLSLIAIFAEIFQSSVAGIGVAAISSNDVKTYPEDSFENMIKLSRENSFPFPYLFDGDQSVARRYDAICTPDFFGFNSSMGLQYRGRLDASRKEAGPKDLRRDLFEAMCLVAETGKGPKDQIS